MTKILTRLTCYPVYILQVILKVLEKKILQEHRNLVFFM